MMSFLVVSCGEDDAIEETETCLETNKFCHSRAGINWSDSASNTMNFGDAKVYCETLGGRLPTIGELRALIKNCPVTITGGACKVTDDCLSYTACWSEVCMGCDVGGSYSVFNDKGWFWSGSNALDSSYSWRINFDDGNLGAYNPDTALSVRCVQDNYDTFLMEKFFEEYLNHICNIASNCNPGFVTVDNLNYCPELIMNNPAPSSYFRKGETANFMKKYNLLVSSEKEGLIRVDMEQATKCFSVIEGSNMLCNPIEDVNLLDIAECASVFKGTMPIGSACNQDEECHLGWCSVEETCPGLCVEYKNPSESCNKESDKCSPGSYCSSLGSCFKITEVSSGDPCRLDSDCNRASYCYKQNLSDEIGTCFNSRKLGESCSSDSACVPGSGCINSVCSEAGISNVAGTTCDDIEGSVKCNIFSKLECSPQKTCQMFPEKGQQCSNLCEKTLYCNDFSLCESLLSEESSCVDDSQCATFNCKDGKCKINDCDN